MAAIEQIRNAAALSTWCENARKSGQRVGFVPTMGALHEGHLNLVREARARADVVVTSIFVNPTQFGPNEDFARYPRDIDGDTAKVANAGAHAVFVPDVAQMYPPGETTRVRVGGLGEVLCGPFRPGHFEGVATVVSKLFAMVGTAVAVFGRKDYQQLALLRRLAKDLLFPIEIVGIPTVRDADGLAMSSRNSYLSAEERVRSLAIPRALASVAQAFGSGERDTSKLQRLADDIVRSASSNVDYVTFADPVTLQTLDPQQPMANHVLLAIACRIGKTRLIDNMVLGEDAPPKVEG